VVPTSEGRIAGRGAADAREGDQRLHPFGAREAQRRGDELRVAVDLAVHDQAAVHEAGRQAVADGHVRGQDVGPGGLCDVEFEIDDRRRILAATGDQEGQGGHGGHQDQSQLLHRGPPS
jgi:hypothetical protein